MKVKEKKTRPPPAAADVPTPLSDSLSFQLRRARTLLSGRYEQVANQRRMPMGGLTVLAAVVRNPGISQSRVGEVFGINKSTMVKLTSYLEERGWVERHLDRDDRRAQMLYATEKGEATLEQMLQSLDKVEARATAEFSREERWTLISLLSRLCDQLSRYDDAETLDGELSE
jgi:DNA-binding MarR family transcriptional regulator